MLWAFRLVKNLFFAFLMELVQLMIFLFFFNSIFTAVTSSHDKMTIIIMIILIIMVLILNISISKPLSP